MERGTIYAAPHWKWSTNPEKKPAAAQLHPKHRGRCHTSLHLRGSEGRDSNDTTHTHLSSCIN